MRNYFTLLKVQFLSFFGLNKVLHQDKSKRLSGFGGMLVFALLFVGAIGFMGYTYAEMFGDVLFLTGRITELLPLMLAMACMVAFFFSFYATASVLYGYRDYDLLMAMPIKTTTIVFAKFTFTYIADLLFSVILLVPSVIKYLSYGVTIGIEDGARLFIMLLFSPLLPMAISVFVGALVSYISSRFKKKNLAQTLMLILVFVGCFLIGFIDGSQGIDYTAAIGKIYFIMPLAVGGFSSWLDLLIFAAVNLVPFVAVMLLVAFTYKFMNTVIKSRKKTKNYKLKTYQGNSQGKTLLLKEIKRLFSDANYTVNSILGPILGVVGVVTICIVFAKIGYVEDLLFIFPVIFAFSCMVGPSTSCSLSLEGNAFWLIKTAPVSMKKLLVAKLAVNAIFNAVPALVSGVVGMIIFGAPWYVCILMSATSTAMALLAGFVGLTFNLLFPKMKWESPVEVVKRSTAVALTVVSAFVYVAACFVIGYFIPLSPILNLLIVFSLTVVIGVALGIFVFIKGEELITKKT